MERALAEYGVPRTWTASNTALGYIWGAKQIAGEKCLLDAGDTGELLGTAFVARDIIRVVDALGEDGMVRYLGNSIRASLVQLAADCRVRLFVRHRPRCYTRGNVSGSN